MKKRIIEEMEYAFKNTIYFKVKLNLGEEFKANLAAN